jgi:hypothetical protein
MIHRSDQAATTSSSRSSVRHRQSYQPAIQPVKFIESGRSDDGSSKGKVYVCCVPLTLFIYRIFNYRYYTTKNSYKKMRHTRTSFTQHTHTHTHNTHTHTHTYLLFTEHTACRKCFCDEQTNLSWCRRQRCHVHPSELPESGFDETPQTSRGASIHFCPAKQSRFEFRRDTDQRGSTHSLRIG